MILHEKTINELIRKQIFRVTDPPPPVQMAAIVELVFVALEVGLAVGELAAHASAHNKEKRCSDCHCCDCTCPSSTSAHMQPGPFGQNTYDGSSSSSAKLITPPPKPAERGSENPGQQTTTKVYVTPQTDLTAVQSTEKEGYLVKQGVLLFALLIALFHLLTPFYQIPTP